jgi:hypothetical protein
VRAANDESFWGRGPGRPFLQKGLPRLLSSHEIEVLNVCWDDHSGLHEQEEGDSEG